MTESANPGEVKRDSQPEVRVRYRIRFAKVGLLRWISHRDLIRLWERMSRRANLPLSMSKGFHRRPRMAFPSALALGVIGLDEVSEVDLCEDLPEQELFERLVADNQPGLEILSVQRLPEGFPKGQLDRSDYSVTIPDDCDPAVARDAVIQLQQQTTVTVLRKGKPIVTHVATEIPAIEVTDTELRFTLVARDEASIRPHDVLALLGLETWPDHGATITRTRTHLTQELVPECVSGT